MNGTVSEKLQKPIGNRFYIARTFFQDTLARCMKAELQPANATSRKNIIHCFDEVKKISNFQN